ncbi:MAG TPA: Fe-S cluster assembly protein SufD [Oleiagrimonas sp.]|nr:Fe-S cluster assembly protein SufD [Oleiagrimonas sp.]
MATPFMTAIAEHAPDALAALPGADLDWLARARREQLDAFLRDGLPGNRNEAWKYTALRALERHAFAHGDHEAAARPVDAEALSLPGVDGPRLVFVNGGFRADLSRLDRLSEGLEIKPLAQALATDAEPLRFFLTRDWQHQADAFARLNAALAGDGVVLRVKAGCRIDGPVQVVHVGVPVEAELAWHVRSIIEVGEGASLKLVEHHVAGSGAPEQLGTLVSDCVLREGAQLDWVMLQNASAKATLIRRHVLRQDARSTARMHAVELGGKLVRNDIDAELRGEGAHLSTRGVFLPHARQHLDTHLDIRHAAGNTSSESLWRGVADQGGHGVFHGQIIIDPGADGTDASLYNKNLLLSDKAAIDTQPVLEIYADEVMANHGATVGQLDERALFYLRSRGIDKEKARHLLTAAFCREALATLDNAALREHLDALLIDVLPIEGDRS